MSWIRTWMYRSNICKTPLVSLVTVGFSIYTTNESNETNGYADTLKEENTMQKPIKKICPMGRIHVDGIPVICARECCAWWHEDYYNDEKDYSVGRCSLLEIAKQLPYVGV